VHKPKSSIHSPLYQRKIHLLQHNYLQKKYQTKQKKKMRNSLLADLANKDLEKNCEEKKKGTASRSLARSRRWSFVATDSLASIPTASWLVAATIPDPGASPPVHTTRSTGRQRRELYVNLLTLPGSLCFFFFLLLLFLFPPRSLEGLFLRPINLVTSMLLMLYAAVAAAVMCFVL
jgi:hypothetical protein